MNRMKASVVIVAFLLLAGVGWVADRMLLGAPETGRTEDVFVVGRKQDTETTVSRLKAGGFIRNERAFLLVLSVRGMRDAIASGGYPVSKDMDSWQIADRLAEPPGLLWVTIPEGWRKEQIGELLAETFGWSDDDLDLWNTSVTATDIDYIEGTYFPDTYLIPTGGSGFDMAQRMTRNFDERFAPFIGRFAVQNIRWTTGLKLASIVQREAAGKDDMPLIAGILWNRLNRDMNLEIDATVQYARGDAGAGWWAPITADDIRNIDSPYNTYKNKGLPPTPIGNPGLDAIEAVLSPTETDCLYYLHDTDRRIRCAATYEEHLANIDAYLRSGSD